jgi:hypothetical protein
MNDFKSQFANALAETQKQFPTWTYHAQYERTFRENKDIYLAACYERALAAGKEQVAMGLPVRPASQFANDSSAVLAESSIPKSRQPEMFGMSSGCTESELLAAFKGNNNKWAPVRYNDVFAALVSFFRKERMNDETGESGSILDAVHTLRDRHPILYARVNGGRVSPEVVAPEIANSKSDGTEWSVVPPKLAALWRISGASALEYSAVSDALGGPTAPFDHNKVLTALVLFYQRQEKLGYSGAFSKALSKYPQLAASFKQPVIDIRGIQK